MVGKAVEQRAGQPLGSEHAGPLVEWQVGGNDGRAALVALAEDLKQQLSPGLRQRHVAEFVDHQELVAGELALQPQQPLLVASLDAPCISAGLAGAKQDGVDNTENGRDPGQAQSVGSKEPPIDRDHLNYCVGRRCVPTPLGQYGSTPLGQ